MEEHVQTFNLSGVVFRHNREWIPKKDKLIKEWADIIYDALCKKFPSLMILMECRLEYSSRSRLPITKCYIHFPNLKTSIEDPVITFFVRHSIRDKVEFVAQVGDSKLTLDELIRYIQEKIAAFLKIDIHSVPVFDEKECMKRWLKYNSEPIRAP